MSLLQGLFQGASNASRFADYQTQRRIATDQNRREQVKFDREQTEGNASRALNLLQTNGLIDSENAYQLDKDAFARGIENDDQGIKQISLEIINSSDALDEGVVATDITPVSGGGYVIQTRNSDGEIGAVTQDGSSDPSSPVAIFNPGKLAGLANLYWRKDVINQLPEADRNRFNVYGADRNLIDVSLKAARATGGKGAERALASAMASASPEEEAQIIEEVTGTPPPKPAAKTPDPTPAPKSKTVDTADIESQIAEKEAELAALSDNTGGGTRGSFRRKDNKKRALEAEIRDLKKQLGPEEKTVSGRMKRGKPITAAAPKVAATISPTATVEEVDAAVDAGKVQADPEEVQQVAQAMKEAGVETVADLARLDREDQMLAYALVRLFTPNEAARENLRQEMNNIRETGIGSYSANELDAATTSRMNAETSRMSELRQGATQLREDVGSTNEYADKLGSALFSAVTDEDGDLSIDTTKIRNLYAPGGAMNAAKTDLKSETNPEAQRRKKDVFNANLSATVMALSSADAGGVWEGLKDAIGWQDDQEFISGNDFQFDRLEGVFEKGVLKEIRIVDPRGGYMDEAVPASRLPGLLGGQIYNYLSQALKIKNEGGDDVRERIAQLMPAGT